MLSLISDDDIARLRDDGFLLMRLPTAASAALETAFAAALSFFRLPNAEKMRSRLPENRGYRPTGIEYSSSPEILDAMETFSASDRTEAAANSLPSAKARLLHEKAMAARDVLEPIAEEFATQLARASRGEPPHVDFRGAFRRWSEVQLNYALPMTDVEFINEAHEDGTLVTIGCATRPAFEMRTRAGAFVPLTASPPEVIIMPGAIAALLSGGFVQPLYHRVRRTSACLERMALLFNGDIDPRLCSPWVKNEMNAGVDIGSRVLTNASHYGITPFKPE